MQGVLMPENPHQGSPPPHDTLDVNMEVSPANLTKEKQLNQSVRSDSGIYSSNSTFDNACNQSRCNSRSQQTDSDNRSDCSSPEAKPHTCPICDTMLTSQHDFTLHIKSHNNTDEIQQDSEKGFTCRICFKVLSSSSSLDRHVLVHSGERPFNCKYCGDSFTTNGNMHRHMRTHSQKAKNYESDGSTDSSTSAKSIEFNNNNVDSKLNRKRKLELEDFGRNKKQELEKIDETEYYKCPVCERADFDSSDILDTHLKDNHPEYPAKCFDCNQLFHNQKQLELHCNAVHDNINSKPSIIGFKDLTFVDFSSEKFQHIARYECEKNLHKGSGNLKFQCKRCFRAFPSANSLEFHEKDCSNMLENHSLDLSKSSMSDTDLKRNDFFSNLNLQNNSPEKDSPPVHLPKVSTKLKQQLLDGSKDFADIQTIISMTTNGSLLHQLQTKSNEMIIPNTKNVDLNQDFSKNEEEETQDAFATEFRKMKLRGEFPCRLCTTVFPNLRALKGHNRTHLNANNNGTYRCNMCPHSSIDKAALIRHMRTHNGDRPYECALCNYAFTTKANCERHLRNRHAKTTREDVKKSIIYHPSEDPTNEDLNKIVNRDDVKKTINSSGEIGDVSPEINSKHTDILPVLPEIIKNDIKQFPTRPLLNKILSVKEPASLFPSMNNIIRNENLKSLKDFKTNQNNLLPTPISPYCSPKFNFTPSQNNISTPEHTHSTIRVKNTEMLQNSLDSDDEYNEIEDPMNQVLDLSKKKENDKKPTDERPQDLTTKSNLNQALFAQQFSKNPPKFDPTALLTQWAFLRSGFPALPSWPTLPINPFFPPFQTPMTPTNVQDIAERYRNQLCGGAIIADNRVKAAPPMPLPNSLNPMVNGLKDIRPEHNLENFSTPGSSNDMKPLMLNVDTSYNESLNKIHSPITPSKNELLQSPNSVKMVIKNGVLMPKQKQRRYRTERPFTCDYCSARFTLRSNMERHIKQQHPQFWSQRQRGNVGNPGRKPQCITNKSNYCDLSIPSYEAAKNQDFEESKEAINSRIHFEMLAQHLRRQQLSMNSHIKKEEEEDDALIIDENGDKHEDEENERCDFEVERPIDFKIQLPKKDAKNIKHEENQDLVPVARLLDNASQQPFKDYFKRETDDNDIRGSEEDEEGLVASGSTSEGNISGTDENRSESDNPTPAKKKSAYSLAPNRVSCQYCNRKFPWTSSLRRHILTHTGQKPFKCSHCPLLFTTKSNCDRHLLRKHGNSATTMPNDYGNNANYLMRNVPERPFKCSNCPSSTFSTYSNLKKHISCKHATNAQGDDIKAQGYEAGSSEDEKVTNIDSKRDWESQISHSKSSVPDSQTVPVQNSDQPFKCHLCEGSFTERQEALDHIKDKHASEYNLLMSKNALDANATTPDEGNHQDEDDNEMRGKFPDYSNRKVICAFCMRRFWSAEDLRRHMRTHTGERPFSCDICRRRFTLKHSMLRHRKKHADNDNINSDEEVPTICPNFEDKAVKANEKTDESDGTDGNDLISKLLGIRSSFIDKALTASPDDAAKLLGVRD